MQKIITTLAWMVVTSTLLAQGTEFFTGSWVAALKKAEAENKILLVDAHTSWCAPCRRMKKEVFPLKEVGDFLRKDFITLAVDLETPRGLLFSLYYEVKAYPSFLLIDVNGKILHRSIGFKNPQQLQEMCTTVLDKYQEAEQLKTEWLEGNRETDFIKHYILALQLANQPIPPEIFIYLSENDWSEETKAAIIFDVLDGVSGPLMDELLKGERLSTLHKDLVEDKILSLWMQEMEAAFNHHSKKQQRLLKKRTNSIPYVTQAHFDTYKSLLSALKKENTEQATKATIAFFDLLSSNKIKRKFLKEIFNQQSEGKSLNSTAIQLSEKLFKTDDRPKNGVLYLKLLILDGQYEKSKPYMDKILNTAIQQKDYPTQIELRRFNKFIRKKLAGL